MWSALNEQLKTTILGDIVREYDILALEKWGYFDDIEKEWLSSDKQVECIDPSNGFLSNAVWLWALWITVGNILTMYWIDVLSLWKEKHVKNFNRKKYFFHILKTLGISQLSFFPPTMVWSMLTADDNEYQSKYDIGHTWDARTIFMTMEIMKLQEKYPNKSIASITWNGHAKGIEYYLNDAEWQREFKSVIYNIVYGIFKLI